MLRWPKDDFSSSKVDESVKMITFTAGLHQKAQMKPISKTITFIAHVVQKPRIVKIINFSADVRQNNATDQSAIKITNFSADIQQKCKTVKRIDFSADVC